MVMKGPEPGQDCLVMHGTLKMELEGVCVPRDLLVPFLNVAALSASPVSASSCYLSDSVAC